MADYPNTPGHRGVDTSIEAAESIAAIAGTIRTRVYEVVEEAGFHGATGDDIAEALNLLVFQVRARTSELRAAGKIVDSERRRKGASGRSAIVWVLPQFGLDSDDPQLSFLEADAMVADHAAHRKGGAA